MRLFFRYLREQSKWMLLYLFGICIMVVILQGNEAEMQEIMYGATLLVVCLLVVTGVDFFHFRRKQDILQKIRQKQENIAEYLDMPENLQEEIYQEMIKDLEKQRVAKENAMRLKMAALKEYYAMWVHQIKTPISALSLLLQEQEEDVRSAEQLRAMEQDELFRIEQYVEMALQYARLDSEYTDFVFEEVKLDKVIREAVHKYARLFVRKKVRFNYQETEQSVLTDRKWLGFVIEQLLSNAIKYAPGGTVSVYFTTKGELVVEDDGIGIKAEDLHRVTDKGYTGYNGHNHKTSSGIGLYLANRIMKKMNHNLRIESEEGKGTKVILSFQDGNLTEM